MTIEIQGARENNLKGISTSITDGLTVVTGISGSGKSSLVYDTIFHEARRRYIDIFTPPSSRLRMKTARVDAISGLSPAISIDQNSINRNPLSTLATATGLHPFFRILYTNYGTRKCPQCLRMAQVRTRDEIVTMLLDRQPVTILSTLVFEAYGSHQILLEELLQQYKERIIIDGSTWEGNDLAPSETHTIQLVYGPFEDAVFGDLEHILDEIYGMNISTITVKTGEQEDLLSLYPVCPFCDLWFTELEPKHFHLRCLDCEGEGCEICADTGIHPEAAVVTWNGYTLPELLRLSVLEISSLFNNHQLPSSSKRLIYEIYRRLEALLEVGLGYLTMDRSSPTLSRGESQRVRMSVVLSSRMENMLHVLDEPVIGLSFWDTLEFLPALRQLQGPVLYVEHDRIAASIADEVIDIGSGAGADGGEIVFQGSTELLWESDTETGQYFSLRSSVDRPKHRPVSDHTEVISLTGVGFRYLRDFDISIPLQRLTVISGVSGSGKSTLVEEVIAPTLTEQTPVGCTGFDGPKITVTVVDQSPIGRNPRSNPATYTKLSDIIRDLYASASGLSKSHFSFNRKEGQCPECKGIGAEEYKLPFVAPMWLQCEACDGARFNEKVRQIHIPDAQGNQLPIHELYKLTIKEAAPVILASEYLTDKGRKKAQRLLTAMVDIGLDYLTLGQPSPTLSGGEAQRIKLTKFLGKPSTEKSLLILDEPTTALHPSNLSGLLVILDRLIETGATVLIVEHNLDVIRAADWLIELGPGSGARGGELTYQGTINLEDTSSRTMKALREEQEISPQSSGKVSRLSSSIVITGARTNNLRDVSLEIPKHAITVVTGRSGSGKSSLVRGVLELEARRRFLESLSVYERQSTLEGAQAEVESVSGLGVTAAPRSGGISYAWRIDPRYTLGKATEISTTVHQLLFALGRMICPKCDEVMVSEQEWLCPQCDHTIHLFDPSYLSIDRLSSASMGFVRSACPECKGLGQYQVPNVDKLIVDPTKPICGGAMYSPGFWPYGYYCKKYNGAYMILQGLARVLDFDPATTPWNEMSAEAQQAFLYGYDEEIEYTYESRTRGPYPATGHWQGPFREWGGLQFSDHFGTYSDTKVCERCQGKKLRDDYLALRLEGHSVYDLEEMPLSQLELLLSELSSQVKELEEFHQKVYTRLMARLRYLNLAGLGYMNQNRLLHTLSAGEYERMRLAKILGSGLTSMTILLDEPTRGLHPSEIDHLISILRELKAEGNQIIVVEHDLDVIRAADTIVDLGPEGGGEGGEVVMQCEIENVDTDLFPRSYTAQWLTGQQQPVFRREGKHIDEDENGRRLSSMSMRIVGARHNNLKDITIDIPLGILTGICGVSGSGKSSLIIDTLVRVVAPKKHTSSLAQEEVDPGDHDAIENVPRRILYVDQAKTKVRSPWHFLGLRSALVRLFVQSEDGDMRGIDDKLYKERCDVCKGRGSVSVDMGFLPTVHSPCDICEATGFSPAAFEIKLRGHSLPEVVRMTIDEVYQLYHELDTTLERKLQLARDFGLGYLVLRQPVRTLSAGEVQRLRLVKELAKKSTKNMLFIFDEPTVGMAAEDVKQLISIFHTLVDEGHSVLVIEHHLHLLAACDWLIELGPVGGPQGGYVIAHGTPEDLVEQSTPTAPYLKEIVEVTR